MPPGLRPARMPSGPSATAFTALASVTIENTISDFSATARGVSAQAMPVSKSVVALARERFQPVTVCPAFIKRGTINCPMAPSPTNPRFTASFPRARHCAGSIHGSGDEGEGGQDGGLRQLIVALAETGEAHRKADAFLRRLEDDEGRVLAGAKFLDELVVHDHFGDATVGQAAHETGAADIGGVDLEA